MSEFTETLVPLYLKLFNWEFRDRYGSPFIKMLMEAEENCVRFKDYTVFLNPDDKTATELFLTHVNSDGWIWESHQISLFVDSIRRNTGCAVLDIGANYGAYSLSAAKLAEQDMLETLVAIEPNRNTFACLKKSIEFNGFGNKVKLVHAAVSDNHNVMCNFYADPKYSAMSKSKGESEKSSDSATYQVKCVRMDNLLSECGIDKRSRFVIKIDVEGSEPLVFAGLEETLSSAEGYQIYFEFHPTALQDSGNDPYELAKMILALEPELIAEIDHHNSTVKPIKGAADFERLVKELLNPTKMWSDFTNIFISQGMILPGGM